MVGYVDMNLTSPSWSEDRIGSPNSALQLSNGGYGQLPAGNYFSTTGFSVMVWVKLLSVKTYQRIIDFELGKAIDNLLFLFDANDLKLSCLGFNGLTSTTLTSPNSISLNTWYNVAMTVNAADLKLYVDGDLVASYSGKYINI